MVDCTCPFVVFDVNTSVLLFVRAGLFAPSRGTQGKKSALDYP